MGRPGRNGIRGNLCRGRVRRRGARVCASGRPCPAAFLPSCSGNAVKTNKRTDATKAAGEAEFVASVLSFVSFVERTFARIRLLFCRKGMGGVRQARSGWPPEGGVSCGKHSSTLRQVLVYFPQSTFPFSARFFPAFRSPVPVRPFLCFPAARRLAGNRRVGGLVLLVVRTSRSAFRLRPLQCSLSRHRPGEGLPPARATR